MRETKVTRSTEISLSSFSKMSHFVCIIFFQRKVCHGDFHGVPLSVLINQETMLFHLVDDVPNAFHGYVGKTYSKTIEDVSLIGIE